MLALALNLFRLQVLDAQELQERAIAQQTINYQPFVPRRPIVDASGNVLAIDRPAFTLYAHPILFSISPLNVATQLAPLLRQDVLALAERLDQGESGIELKYALSESEADKIRALGIDGLELVRHQQRIYPQNDLFANIIGYVNVDQQGQAGIEASHQAELQRPVKAAELRLTGDGLLLPDQVPEGFFQVDDLSLQLALDSSLQRTARTSLQEQMAKYQAKRGAVLVMDVRDGSLPVLVTEPTYNPNDYSSADVSLFRNWAITDLYEPGSTFKPVNVAIALEEGKITPEESFYDEGAIEVGGWPIENFDYRENGGRGNQTVTEIITYSSNVGMVHIMQRLEPETYYRWLERLQLEEATGIDLPSEASGQMKDHEQFISASIEPATTAFGQGFSLTPLKLLQLHGTLASGGKLMVPHVVQGLVDSEGNLVTPMPVDPPKSLFSQKTAQQVLTMMEHTVDEGTGRVARIPGHRIAGKTGTAQKASPDGGYLENARITSFVSILPANQPRYVVAVVVDEPQGDDAYGSTVSAPVARSVMNALISRDQLLPTEPITPEDLMADPEQTDATQDETFEEEYVPAPLEESTETWQEESWEEIPPEP